MRWDNKLTVFTDKNKDSHWCAWLLELNLGSREPRLSSVYQDHKSHWVWDQKAIYLQNVSCWSSARGVRWDFVSSVSSVSREMLKHRHQKGSNKWQLLSPHPFCADWFISSATFWPSNDCLFLPLPRGVSRTNSSAGTVLVIDLGQVNENNSALRCPRAAGEQQLFPCWP